MNDTMFTTNEADLLICADNSELVQVSMPKGQSISVHKQKLLQAICPQPHFVQITSAADGVFVLFALDKDGLIWKMEYKDGQPNWKIVKGPQGWRQK